MHSAATKNCFVPHLDRLQIMSELFGKKTGCCRGQGGSMHMFDREHGLVRSLPLLLPPLCTGCSLGGSSR